MSLGTQALAQPPRKTRLEMLVVVGGMPIRTCFCTLRIILYTIFFGQVNQILFSFT